MTTTLLTDTDYRGVHTITLNRPEVHNAFNEVMIAELHHTLVECENNAAIRLVILNANGKSFSAGADINWMRQAVDYSEDKNYDDAMDLAQLLKTLDSLPKPTIAYVQGLTYGGGVGLISCCDIVLALKTAVFCLSEVKLGLAPAVISPYVVRAIGGRAARRYFQSAERFTTEQANQIGLVHEIVESEAAVEHVVSSLLEGGPNAQRISKEMIKKVRDVVITDATIEDTVRCIAKVRVSAEGQEGLNAFLDKRRSQWQTDSNDP